MAMCVIEAYGGKHCVGQCLEPRDCTDKPYPNPSTFGDFLALPLATREALNRQWLELTLARTEADNARFLSGDYDLIDSHRRFELGE